MTIKGLRPWFFVLGIVGGNLGFQCYGGQIEIFFEQPFERGNGMQSHIRMPL